MFIRMALAGKELGTDVGQWLGHPSVAASAIKCIYSFPFLFLCLKPLLPGRSLALFFGMWF